jgi:hypothetical protein
MPPRLPRSLNKKRNTLAFEREQLEARLKAIGSEIASLDYSLGILRHYLENPPDILPYENAHPAK